MSIVPFYWGGSNLNYQRGLLSLFSLCSEVRITPHHENGLLHLHLVWCSILSSETAETLAAARVSGVASFSATLVGAGGGTRTHTVSLPTDFESVTSTNSITPALTLFIISDERPKFKRNLCFRRKIPDSAGRMAVPSCKERKIGVLCL